MAPHRRITPLKVCDACHQFFERGPKEKFRNWNKRRFCSTTCDNKTWWERVGRLHRSKTVSLADDLELL